MTEQKAAMAAFSQLGLKMKVFFKKNQIYSQIRGSGFSQNKCMFVLYSIMVMILSPISRVALEDRLTNCFITYSLIHSYIHKIIHYTDIYYIIYT